MVGKNQDGRETGPDNFITFEQMSIIANSQRLWLQLALWINTLIHTVFRDSERKPVVFNRVYQGVSMDFYNMILVFYGSEIAQQFLNLFSNFILNLWRVIESLNENNQEAINTNTVQLYRSADILARFLARINLFWDEAQWQSLLYQYIRMKIDEVLAVATRDFEREIDIFDRIQDLTVIMGNYMARGIIARNLPLEQMEEERAGVGSEALNYFTYILGNLCPKAQTIS